MAVPKIRKLDVLVHPFFEPHSRDVLDRITSLNNRKVASEMEAIFSTPKYLRDFGRFQNQKLRMWKRRVDQIAKSKGHYLAIVEMPGKSTHHYETFLEYARKKLGNNRIIISKDSPNRHPNEVFRSLDRSVRTLGYDSKRIKFNIYGEYGVACVPPTLDYLISKLIPKERFRQAARVSLALCSQNVNALFEKAYLKTWADPETNRSKLFIKSLIKMGKQGAIGEFYDRLYDLLRNG
jgi:hypothetical protein